MKTIYFVRHGEAAAGFGAHRDPGLSALGQTQADATATHLATLDPMPIFSSPLQRAQQTAKALATKWDAPITIEDRIAEIPSPIDDLTDRSSWLASVMAGRWRELPPNLKTWRTALIECVVNAEQDCVMFSHFVAINLLVGEATNEAAMVSFRPANASITRFESDGTSLKVLSLGEQAQTHVN
ncbi:MAG: histidine phosphatase family protein [Gammaproteobacteria bacterium]|nr:histidine phosphatase family protein [Gammaproteobacteria bacterium]